MIVNGNCQVFFRFILANDILVQKSFDLYGLFYFDMFQVECRFTFHLFLDDIIGL